MSLLVFAFNFLFQVFVCFATDHFLLSPGTVPGTRYTNTNDDVFDECCSSVRIFYPQLVGKKMQSRLIILYLF